MLRKLRVRATVFLQGMILTLVVLGFLIPELTGVAKQPEPQFQGGLSLLSADPRPQGLTTAAELETFIDKFFNQEMSSIPGAVFVLVKNGQIFLSKGYRYANWEQKTPVDPDKTLFRVGSLSKLFTTTAAMQLVEQGKLDINRDTQQDLIDLEIKDTFAEPLTLAHLLTHADGFDVAWTVGAANKCQSERPSLRNFLADNMPPRVRPPGELYVYGDAGMALAGRLVEAVSGMPFIEYVNQNILQPLDMEHSSFLQPLPAELSANLATGYASAHGGYDPTPFLCGYSVPTIGLSTTAIDMAHFMIAQLEGGLYANQQILSNATVEEMQRQQFTHFPKHVKAAGSAYGFYERLQNHQRALEHGGNLYGHTSQIFLLPEHGIGFFIAFNTDDKSELRERLIKQFLDHYYPQQKQPGPPLEPDLSAAAQDRSRQISGIYRFVRYPHDSIAKFWTICFGSRPDLRLEANSDGTFTLLPRGTRWVEVEPWLLRYRDADDMQDSNNYLSVRQNASGQVTGMALSNYVFVAYEKLNWHESVQLHKRILAGCCLIFLATCGSFLGIFVHRRSHKWFLKQSKFTRLSRVLTSVTAALNLLFVAGILWLVASVNYWEFFTGIPAFVVALLCLPIAATVLTLGMPIVALLAWKDKRWSVPSRLLYLLTTLASGVFLILLNYWNLLGFRF